MRTRAELRVELWRAVRSGWFWRIVLLGGVLLAVAAAAEFLLPAAFRSMDVRTWSDFAELQRQTGAALEPPTRLEWWRMTGASSFQTFVRYLFGGIASLGVSAMALAAVRRQNGGTFAAAFAGVRIPFDAFYLAFRLYLQIVLWTLLLIVPGIIAAIRYSQSWFLKADHPDWSAGRCIGESCRMMAGRKLDYVVYVLCVILPILALVIGATTLALVLFASDNAAMHIVSLAWVLIASPLMVAYGALAQAVFYRELVPEQPEGAVSQ